MSATVFLMQVNGMLPDDLNEAPSIVSVSNRANKPFISVSADVNPLNEAYDANVDVNVETITIVFDAVSNNVSFLSLYIYRR
jgi:hypothetical protein